LNLCLCLTDQRNEGDYVYAWGKLGRNGNLNDESILPEELDLAQNNRPWQRNWSSTSVSPSVIVVTNTLKKFSNT